MNIIFGSENAEKILEKYTVLELDTFKFPDQEDDVVAYCVVDSIPLEELAQSALNLETHGKMIEAFKTQNWNLCLDLIDTLQGLWNGDVDTYYDDVRERVQGYVKNPPDNWTHVIIK